VNEPGIVFELRKTTFVVDGLMLQLQHVFAIEDAWKIWDTIQAG
jgi:hypothetical protein